MYGIFIDGKRPKSKKAVKDAILADASRVVFENTSMFGGSDYDGTNVPSGLTFVGPDPYTSRKFYGSISYKNGKPRVD